MKASPKITIYNHMIFLTETQRYDLYACIPVESVGILVMAEISKNMKVKNIKEVFYKYLIDCEISNNPVELRKNFIKIHVPSSPVPVFEMAADNQLEYNNDTPDMYDILNKDEGGRESLFYETFLHNQKLKHKHYHKIEIKDEKLFDESVEFLDFSSSSMS